MLALKLYLGGMLLFLLYCGVRFIAEDSTSWFEFILVLILNVWLLPIWLYVRVRKKNFGKGSY